MPEAIRKKSVLYYESPLFKTISPKIIHGFVTRMGRLSDGTLIELDLSLRPDNKTNALLLYELISNSFDFFHKRPIFMGQPHKGEIAIIKDIPNSTFIAGYDGMITNNKKIVLNVLTADCASVLIVNRNASVIGAFHIGWKSLLSNIISKAIENFVLMKILCNDIFVSVGPAIQGCCYEVQEEIRYKTKSVLGQDVKKVFKESGDKLYFDLPGAIKEVFLQSGIPSGNQYISPLCTCCLKDLFYSHRRDKKEHRMLSFITLDHDKK